MEFNRYGLWLGQTWNHHLFKRHHTELNNIYWAYASSASFSKRQIAISPPDDSPANVFHYPDQSKQVLQDAIEWRTAFNSFENWTRLSSLMALSSYFEIYLRKSVTLALESDPGLQYGRSKSIDGFMYKKHSKTYSFLNMSEDCVKGEWSKRLSSYKSLFGTVPQSLIDNQGELEQMRNIRNGVGHAFGRTTTEYNTHIHIKPKDMARLTEERFIRWLGLIDKIAKDIDDQLGKAHVGEYESLCFLHSWLNETPRPQHTRRREFMKSLHRWTGVGPGKNFSTQIMDYYDRI